MRCSICNSLLYDDNSDTCGECSEYIDDQTKPTHETFYVKSKKDYVELFKAVKAARFADNLDEAKEIILSGRVCKNNETICDVMYKLEDNDYFEVDGIECILRVQDEDGYRVWKRIRKSLEVRDWY